MTSLGAWIATALGAGRVPYGPGTAGTLVAVPLAWWLGTHDAGARAAVLLAVIAVGTWAIERLWREVKCGDHPSIVIDEVAGYLVASWTAGRDSSALFAAFFFFRIFDILKPPPVRNLDLWSKKRTGHAGAFGVIADDLAAGAMALVCVMLLERFGYLRWF